MIRPWIKQVLPLVYLYVIKYSQWFAVNRGFNDYVLLSRH